MGPTEDGIESEFTELLAAAGVDADARNAVLQLAEEEAALRRVATLVARGVEPDEIFAAVSAEVSRLFGSGLVSVYRFEDDEPLMVACVGVSHADVIRPGTRYELGEGMAPAKVFRTGRSARSRADANRDHPLVQAVARTGPACGVASPISVDGRLWGVVGASSKEEFPPGTEDRLEKFTELVATAIANSDSREGLVRIADEQAALRRVATLVARGVPPDEIFAAVSSEVDRLFRSDVACVLKFAHEEPPEVVAVGTSDVSVFSPGTRFEIPDGTAILKVFRTGRSARARVAEMPPDDPHVRAAVRLGVVSSVASPVTVDGRLWGAMVATGRENQLPLATERRLEKFTDLIATAIASTESKSALAASRARIAAAADDERRRVVRDLHDGAQQRLVHMVINLKLAQRALAEGAGDEALLVQEAIGNAEQAVAELRELAHGILPSVLTRHGLRASIDALGSRTPVPVEVDVSVDRLPAPVEATAYFVVAEALTNVAKYASAGRCEVVVRIDDDVLRVDVSDDGVGGASPDGSGLVGLADRLAILDGRLEVDSSPGRGTRLMAVIPMPRSDRSVSI